MWDEGSRLYGLRELVLTLLLPAATIFAILSCPWTAFAIVPAFLIWVGVRERESQRRWKAYHETFRRKEIEDERKIAEDEKNRELGEKLFAQWLKAGGGK